MLLVAKVTRRNMPDEIFQIKVPKNFAICVIRDISAKISDVVYRSEYSTK